MQYLRIIWTILYILFTFCKFGWFFLRYSMYIVLCAHNKRMGKLVSDDSEQEGKVMEKVSK